ncbi:unnamed protein product, partial [marine sediment metagenome]
SCGGEIYRLISKNGNFILKGSGYYSTDNRNGSYKSEKKRLSTSAELRKLQLSFADVVITPKVGRFHWSDFSKPEQCV